ncbi:MAG: hypothetical protein IKV85_05885 [Ruminococcus sp.]|nr:hypothetical protein [Ruminococcus sp.]
MDGIIISAAVVLAVIALIEITGVFTDLSDEGVPAYVTVLPVFAEDSLFDMRLEYLMRKSGGRRKVVLVDFSADNRQIELCSRFVNNNPDAAFIHYTEMKNFFAEIFAFHEKI